jgi:hypothetical protein
MSTPAIKSGLEVVREFLESLQTNAAIAPDVVASVQGLQQQGKLTKVRLLQALAEQRKDAC